jgi:hypothetical protein
MHKITYQISNHLQENTLEFCCLITLLNTFCQEKIPLVHLVLNIKLQNYSIFCLQNLLYYSKKLILNVI